MCPKPFRKPRSRSMRMEPEPLPPPVCYCVPWFLCFDVISNPQSLDVQQDPSSVLMILICLYSLSLISAAILHARSSPPWMTVDRPFLFLIRHNPTGAHTSSLWAFLLVYETVILKCFWYEMHLKSDLVLFSGTILFAGQINKPWARDRRRFDQLSTHSLTHTDR